MTEKQNENHGIKKTRYAVMSDLHANPRALETALLDAHAAGCGKFILLGDITGYGYDPKRTLELARKSFDIVLLGNHDSACVGLEPELEVNTNENYVLDRKARELLTVEERAWLRAREYTHEEAGFVCTHGEFTEPSAWGYIRDCEDAELSFYTRDERLMFCGHTHVAAIWEMMANGRCHQKAADILRHPAQDAESVTFALDQTSRYIINVGSVGYPRFDFCSTYCIYEVDALSITIRRLPFDFNSYITEMLDHNYKPEDWLRPYQTATKAE